MKSEPRNPYPSDPLSAMQRLRSAPWSVPDPHSQEQQRQRVVGRLNDLHRDLVSRRQQRLRWALAVAAGVVLALFAALSVNLAPPEKSATGLRVLQGDLQVFNAGVVTANTAQSLSLRVPIEVEAAQSAATVQLPSRARVELSAATRAALSRSTALKGNTLESVELRSGIVSLTVPPLGRTGSLQVVTPHAVVEVHGTKFRVELEGERTYVSVQSGLVSVEFPAGRVLLRPGQKWHSARSLRSLPSASPQASPPKEAQQADKAAPPSSAPELRKRKPHAKHPKPPSEGSKLDDQNRMLQGAFLAKRAGLRELALSRLQQVLETYPRAEVAHSARVERMRLLRGIGRVQDAREAARDYLVQHPRGFARNEARALVENP